MIIFGSVLLVKNAFFLFVANNVKSLNVTLNRNRRTSQAEKLTSYKWQLDFCPRYFTHKIHFGRFQAKDLPHLRPSRNQNGQFAIYMISLSTKIGGLSLCHVGNIANAGSHTKNCIFTFEQLTLIWGRLANILKCVWKINCIFILMR